MSALTTAGARPAPARSLEESLGQLKRWREDAARALAALRRWAVVGRMLDESDAARLAHLEQRLAGERLTVAFVAEFSRGKSELINALFFAALGVRVLPSGAGRTTWCTTEMMWDPRLPAAVRLLPIDTRLKPRALREWLADSKAWKEIAVDPAHPASLANACASIADTLELSAGAAAELGLADAGAKGRVTIPRWRYAVVNFPHPLLALGVSVLDTPGHNAFGAEAEIAVHRIPEAAAVVFLLSADTGVTKSDRDIWEEHIEPVQGLAQSALVVLNKIDGLRDGMKSEGDLLSAIDRQIRSSAELLGVEPTRIFALSARQALVGRIQGDPDAVAKSRIYRLEQALAKSVVHDRREDHARTLRAETRPLLAQMRALVKSRIDFAVGQLEELTALQGKNQKLVEALARKSSTERGRLEQARAAMTGLRSIHNRLGDRLGRLLDPNEARETAVRARAAMMKTTFSAGIGEAIDAFFATCAGRIDEAVGVMEEANGLMRSSARRFRDDFGVAAPEVVPFGTDRFRLELERLERLSRRELRRASTLLLKPRAALAEAFFDTVALKVIHIFEIADREVRAWLSGFVRPLDAELSASQDRTNTRIEGMGRIQNAESSLFERMEEMRGIVRELAALRDELEAHAKRLDALLEPARSALAL